jgi:hypothetical protein
MGDFVTNSQTSLATLYDHCDLLKNVLHDVLRLEVGDKLDHVRHHIRFRSACATELYSILQTQLMFLIPALHWLLMVSVRRRAWQTLLPLLILSRARASAPRRMETGDPCNTRNLTLHIVAVDGVIAEQPAASCGYLGKSKTVSQFS